MNWFSFLFHTWLVQVIQMIVNEAESFCRRGGANLADITSPPRSEDILWSSPLLGSRWHKILAGNFLQINILCRQDMKSREPDHRQSRRNGAVMHHSYSPPHPPHHHRHHHHDHHHLITLFTRIDHRPRWARMTQQKLSNIDSPLPLAPWLEYVTKVYKCAPRIWLPFENVEIYALVGGSPYLNNVVGQHFSSNCSVNIHHQP